MCGIIGINYNSGIDLLKTTEMMQNRGPDNTSVKEIDNNYFGHTRLSIVDLDEEANQPMVFDDILIVFNGEIYNYDELSVSESLECKTKSDTEVLIRLYQKYDTEFLSLLNGAFSFCIYDIKKERYFCARDRYGKKPFYYYAKENKFIFSSMIKPIIKVLGFTPKLNKVALSQYLQYFVPLAPNTFYTDINKLDSSSYLLYENNTLSIKKYYKIKTYKKIENEALALKKVEDILFSSVEQRLKSDVEVGTLLSGGIDSSLISSIYSKITRHKINTFSVGYKTHQKYSELPYAKIVANNIKSNHTALEISQKDYINSLEDVFENLEEPHADPAAIPLYLLTKEINKQGIKTVLSGEGSDELFLGYDNYAKFLKYYEFSNSLDKKQIQFLNEIISSLGGNKEAEYLRRVVKNENIYNSFGEIYTTSQRKKLLQKVATFKAESPKKDPVDWMSYIDTKIWLGEALLSKVDKMSMANSVETRNPFLDFRLVDTAFSINSSLKVGDTNKYLLKKVASKYIPQEIIHRQKKGFNSPFNEWLFLEYDSKLLEVIYKVNDATNLFNDKYIKLLYQNAKNNKMKQHFYALWCFCIWFDKNYL
ncbi:asparagine synthase (glutamine-hydrolyzing) [Arcobacter sp. 15-2]|uniref:asparagine synthase (glutamine-hydrolyzing) n=1 Tax=Arcobacter sp. 15-2 TaxID=3374109 RepID=UPI00399D2029